MLFSRVDTLSVESENATTVLAEVGTFRNGSEIVQALGVPPPKEETSLDFSGGMVAKVSDTMSLAVDAFRVEVDDRIVFSSNVTGADLQPVLPAAAAFMEENHRGRSSSPTSP